MKLTNSSLQIQISNTTYFYTNFTAKIIESSSTPNKIFFLSIKFNSAIDSNRFILQINLPNFILIPNENKSYYITNNTFSVNLVKYMPCPTSYYIWNDTLKQCIISIKKINSYLAFTSESNILKITFDKDVSSINEFILSHTEVYINGVEQSSYNYTIIEMNKYLAN